MNKLLILLMALLLTWPVSPARAGDGHDHDDEKTTEQEAAEDHSGHDHEQNEAPSTEAEHDESTHEDHGDELTVELTPEAAKIAGIATARVTRSRIGETLELPGEVGFNEDRLVHIAPRFPGIAIQVNCGVGDYVKAGDVVAQVESNESLNAYSITAPISGWVIERHITPGEFVSEQSSIFVIADLSTVWVNLAVYPRDADLVRKGQIAKITAIGTRNVATGSIKYVTPIVDPRTRSLTARITLANPDNSWRPGTFVRATITTESGAESLVVERDAVQFLQGKRVIFVVDGPNRFRPMEVITGNSDHRYIQITSELKVDTEYVSKGAFELKAKIITGNLDAHAGHGH